MNLEKSCANQGCDLHVLKRENEILKEAISYIHLHVFVYNTISGEICFIGNGNPPLDFPVKFNDGIRRFLTNPAIDLEYVDSLANLFESILHGEKSAGMTIKTWDSSVYSWYHILLTNSFDKNNNLNQIIGTIQDVTDRIESSLHYSKEEQFRLAMLADDRRVYEINVTRDRFIRLESITDNTDYGSWKSYTEAMNLLCQNFVYKEDWDAFLEVANRENLLNAFQKETTEFYCEYRVIEKDGTLSWSSSTTHLLNDPRSNDIKGFIYVKNIDEQKKQELLLRRQAEHDSLTGVYNRAASEKLISKILSESKRGDIHGFLSIDIDEFKVVNDTFGHLLGDFLLQEVASGFERILRSKDILARMGGDEFIVFLNDIDDISHIDSITERLCEYVRSIRIRDDSNYRSSISIGIAIYPQNGQTFSELYRKSDSALYYAKQHGKNCTSNSFE